MDWRELKVLRSSEKALGEAVKETVLVLLSGHKGWIATLKVKDVARAIGLGLSHADYSAIIRSLPRVVEVNGKKWVVVRDALQEEQGLHDYLYSWRAEEALPPLQPGLAVGRATHKCQT